MSEPRRCLECGRLTGRYHRRGLCRRCYRDPVIRDGYFCTARGRWGINGYAPLTVEDTISITSLFEAGLSDAEIAEAMGISVSAATKRRQRMGLRVDKAREIAHKRRTR